jgi:hypothetical protein
MIKLIMIGVTFITIISCSSFQKISVSSGLQVVSFNIQSWNGGRPGVGGTNYQTQLLGDNLISPDSLWVNGRVCKLNFSANENGPIKYQVGDTVVFTGGISKRFVQSSVYSSVKVVPELVIAPVVHEGKALMSYIINGEKKYKVISSIEIKPSINYK